MVKRNMNKAVNDILAFGTKIVSFDYDGKRRNVLIGSNIGSRIPPWGKVESRAVRVHGGRKYLVGIVNNEGKRIPKTFAMDKIQNPSF